MKIQFRVTRARAALGAVAAALATAGVAVGVTGNPFVDAQGAYHGCVGINGLLRVVEDGDACKVNETAIEWNQTGPQGEKGEPGPQGVAGPPGPPGGGFEGSACTRGSRTGIFVAFSPIHPDEVTGGNQLTNVICLVPDLREPNDSRESAWDARVHPGGCCRSDYSVMPAGDVDWITFDGVLPSTFSISPLQTFHLETGQSIGLNIDVYRDGEQVASGPYAGTPLPNDGQPHLWEFRVTADAPRTYSIFIPGL